MGEPVAMEAHRTRSSPVGSSCTSQLPSGPTRPSQGACYVFICSSEAPLLMYATKLFNIHLYF